MLFYFNLAKECIYLNKIPLFYTLLVGWGPKVDRSALNVILFFHTPLKSHAREKWSEALGFPSSRAPFPRPLLFRGWGEAEMRVKEGIINQKNGGRFAHFISQYLSSN